MDRDGRTGVRLAKRPALHLARESRDTMVSALNRLADALRAGMEAQCVFARISTRNFSPETKKDHSYGPFPPASAPP